MQDWLYEDGYDATLGVYRAKKEELSALVGPVHQRYFEHAEAQRQKLEAELAAAAAAKKAADEAAKKEAGANEAAPEGEAAADAEMADADPAKNPTVEEVD